MRVVERADGGLALVLNLLAVLQQSEASLVGIAFLALGGAGDGHKVLLHGRTVRGAALLRGERGQHDRVIRFGGVREIGDLGVEGLDVLLEFLGRVGTWNGAGGALSRPASKSAEWSTVLPSVMYSLWVSRPWAASSLTSGTVWSKAMTSVASGLVALMAVTIDEKFVSVGSNVSFSP